MKERAARDPAAVERHGRRLRVRRAILCVLALALTAWLASAAMSPSTGPVQHVLLMVMAALVVLHVVFWQLGFSVIGHASKFPRAIGLPVALLALATSPMVLYPLGVIAVLVSLFSGGAAGPALAIGGTLLLSPIILLLLIATMFAVGRYKGG